MDATTKPVSPSGENPQTSEILQQDIDAADLAYHTILSKLKGKKLNTEQIRREATHILLELGWTPPRRTPAPFNQCDPDTFWRSGDDLKDLRELVDAAYTEIEIMDVSSSPYNQRWKAAWLKRAREFGATPEW